VSAIITYKPYCMKKLSVFLMMFLFITSLNCYSQTIYYSYDEAGNRTKKTIYLDKGSIRAKAPAQEPVKPVEDNSLKVQKIRIFPNPTEGILRIEISGGDENNSDVRISVTDVNGKVIIDKPNEGLITEINLSSYPDGLYILILRQGSQISKWKVIKK
jgi:hypothetical protein